jgi:hypothetical protein
MQHTVFDILNIIYEAVIKKLIEPTKCTFQNCISIDYDMLKLFGVDGCIELIGAGYKIILPEICRNAFTVHPIDKKFDNQICKTIPMLTNIIEKYPDSIVGYGRADFTKFIKMQDNYAVFSTGNSKITEHYLHGTHYTKITSLSACPHKHIVVHFSQTAPPKNLLKFVNDSFNQYESVMIMSSLNKVV